MARPHKIPGLRVITATSRPDRHGSDALIEEIRDVAPSGDKMPALKSDPPDHLDEGGAAVWRRLQPALVQYGFCSPLDDPLVAELCMVTADLASAHKALNRMKAADPEFSALLVHSANGPTSNPIRREIRRLSSDLLRISNAMGIGPLARQQLALLEAGKTADSGNMSKYFGR